jgi:HAD superfamily hydrolase (TIGR01509 family)
MQRSTDQNRAFPLSRVSAVAFDIGDTLFGTTQLMSSALKQTADLMERSGHIRDSASFCRVYWDVDHTVQGPAINHLFSGLRIARKVWRSLGAKPSLTSLGLFLGTYRTLVRDGLTTDSKLVELFDKLRRAGYKLAALTNGSTEEQLEQLFRLGVLELLDVVVTSEDVGVEKPDKRIFERLLSGLSVKADQALMVGNDPVCDIAGAKAVGMPAVLVTGHAQPIYCDGPMPDAVIDDVFALELTLLSRHHNE